MPTIRSACCEFRKEWRECAEKVIGDARNCWPMDVVSDLIVRLENNRGVSYKPFAEGWLQGSKPWELPVDLVVMFDRTLLLSDDQAGAVYRISHQ